METSDTAIVATETATIAPTLDQRIIKIQFHLQNMANSAIEIGKELTECKKVIPHGEWINWLNINFNLKQSSAKNFMAIAERFGNRQSIGDLGYTQMVQLLALPKGEEEKFIEEKAAEGKPVEDMTVKKLREEVKQWKAKAEEAQNKVKGLAAENTNMEMTLDAARKESEMQQRKIAVETKRREDAETNFDFMMRERDRAESWSKKLQTQIDELKKKPPVEIIPADYEENKKALADLQAQLDELKNQPPLIKEPEDYQQLKEEKARLENEIAQLQTQKTIEIVAPDDYEDTKKAVAELQDKLAKTNDEQITFIEGYIDQLFIAARFLVNQGKTNPAKMLDAFKDYSEVFLSVLDVKGEFEELDEATAMLKKFQNDQN